MDREPSIRITKNGPYRVHGHVPLAKQFIGSGPEGESLTWIEGEPWEDVSSYNLCRCGRSGTKPFCDGTHAQIGFDGTETAPREPYLAQAGE
ncbi:CDGSH iron-sulfur domain-containing protein [Salininema proteolyticum]|uniref:CDGSH iron-sulfur domain-containing protein n=1 Tax=Salininema proteolyticum TaxID=1607685 RepID=A0ABV8TU34_9ACTN